VSYAKAAEPIEKLFMIWTRVGPRKHVLGAVHTGATWREPSVCGGDAPVVKILWPLVVVVVVITHNNVCSTEADPDPDLSLEEQAARWKLRQLDRNKNNVNILVISQSVSDYRPS